MTSIAPSWQRYLQAHLPDFHGPLDVKQFQGGQSNPTYLLTTPSASYVMRSKPGPTAKLLASAHAIDREFRVMTALAAHGIPVPRTLLLVEDESVIGRAFFVMEHVVGRIFWEQSLPELPTTERAAIYDEMNRVIAQVARGRRRPCWPCRLRQDGQLLRAADRALEQAVSSLRNRVNRRNEPVDRMAAAAHSTRR